MPEGIESRQPKRLPLFCLGVALLGVPLVLSGLGGGILAAQGPPGGFGGGRGGGRGGGGGGSARASAPVDLTGYWVSIVTEDWIERMAPDSPPSGTGGGRGGGRGGGQAAAGGDPCRVYGAAGSMRVPGRLFISWVDDNTLQVEMDSGSQTRTFHFNPQGPAPSESSLQGYSVASWSGGGGGGRGGRGRGGGGGGAQWGSLEVVTTNLSGGYLLTSRSGYSANTVLTEHFLPHSDFGEDYLTVTAVIDDGGSRMTSSTFKKEADGSKFSPTGCEVVR